MKTHRLLGAYKASPQASYYHGFVNIIGRMGFSPSLRFWFMMG
ncbi:MAG: hypothetical protein Q4A60_05335 [Pasteurellaceae bacterium]|nr:hypothetical protein [Pasteurellaceae bacterium]